MLYKITYAEGRCHNYANSQKDLLEWLGLLKDEVITEIKKIAKICPIVGEVIVMEAEDD